MYAMKSQKSVLYITLTLNPQIYKEASIPNSSNSEQPYNQIYT